MGCISLYGGDCGHMLCRETPNTAVLVCLSPLKWLRLEARGRALALWPLASTRGRHLLHVMVVVMFHFRFYVSHCTIQGWINDVTYSRVNMSCMRPCVCSHDVTLVTFCITTILSVASPYIDPCAYLQLWSGGTSPPPTNPNVLPLSPISPFFPYFYPLPKMGWKLTHSSFLLCVSRYGAVVSKWKVDERTVWQTQKLRGVKLLAVHLLSKWSLETHMHDVCKNAKVSMWRRGLQIWRRVDRLLRGRAVFYLLLTFNPKSKHSRYLSFIIRSMHVSYLLNTWLLLGSHPPCPF